MVPSKGCAKLDALVIKASAGTLFKAKILRCQDLAVALADCKKANFSIYGLSSHAESTLNDLANKTEEASSSGRVFVLGNETEV